MCGNLYFAENSNSPNRTVHCFHGIILVTGTRFILKDKMNIHCKTLTSFSSPRPAHQSLPMQRSLHVFSVFVTIVCFWTSNLTNMMSLCFMNLVLMCFDDHQILQHIKRVSIRLHWDHTLLLAVHLEETVVVQTHHLNLWAVLTPETHPGSTEVRTKRAVFTV